MKIVRLLVPVMISMSAVWLAYSDKANTAERVLSWSDGLCRNRISFDPEKVDEARLRNTVHLLFGPSDFQVPVAVPPFTPQAIAKLDLDQVIEQCRKAIDVAQRLQFIPLKGIEEYRRAEISELKDRCEFETIEIRGYRNPSALREYQPAAACSDFIDALEGKTDTLTVFRETLERNCQRNASPAQCVRNQLANAQKADGMEWVRLYLTGFGWSNCAIKYMSINANAHRREQARLSLEAQFQRAFKVVKEQCDAPPDSYPDLGARAVLHTDIAPGTPASDWSILAMGLFCGSAKTIHPGRIIAYVYGIDDKRLQTGQPLEATLDVGGKASQLMLQPFGDIALAPLGADVVRNLLRARAASVRIKDYKSSRPENLKLDNAGPKIRSALKSCYKF